MFCHVCGTKLNDGAAFCHSCGTQITQMDPTENTEVAASKTADLPVGAREHTVTNESMKDLGIHQTVFKNRIESVDDRETNDRLFTLYGKLVQPLQMIEQNLQYISNSEQILAERTEYEPVGGKVITSILWVVYSIAYFYIAVRFDVAFYRLYGYEDNVKNAIFMLQFLVVPYIAARLTKFLVAFIRYLRERIELKSYQKNARQNIVDCNCKIDEIITKISPYIAYVPPRYRNSDALSHFCDSYLNSRVDNLSEAIKIYDTECRTRRMEQGMDNIRADMAVCQEIICQRLSSIEYNQGAIMAELASVNASIWTANALF